jgi:ribosome-associated translation inhibitor RaiA
MQEYVYECLDKMDRPYKKGIPGIHKNVKGGVQDYFPGERAFINNTLNLESDVIHATGANENAWVD